MVTTMRFINYKISTSSTTLALFNILLILTIKLTQNKKLRNYLFKMKNINNRKIMLLIKRNKQKDSNCLGWRVGSKPILINSSRKCT